MTDTPLAPATTTPEEERFNVTAKFLDSLIERTKNDAFESGKHAATAIHLADDYDVNSWLTTITAPSRNALRRAVADRRWRREGDNPGAAYLGTCEVLRIIRRNGEWSAMVIGSTHYDV